MLATNLRNFKINLHVKFVVSCPWHVLEDTNLKLNPRNVEMPTLHNEHIKNSIRQFFGGTQKCVYYASRYSTQFYDEFNENL